MGKKSLDKGKRGEYQIRDILRSYGYDVNRGSVFAGTQDIYGLLGVHIEVKSCSEIKIGTWIRQSIASTEARQDGIPVVMFRQVSKTHRGLPWLVTMRKSDYEAMGGKRPYATPRNVSIYERIRRTKEAGEVSHIDFYNGVGAVVTMELCDWMELYKWWKLPFTE